ncbi:MAG: S8 family serine peptidase [Desulfobacteraceae bacterium]|nr:S8 family serine peptidase [Desulfobacteraceae bacterium]
MKRSKCFISPRIGFLACFLFIFLCSFFILPSSSELSQAKRDKRAVSSDTRKENKLFPAGQRGVWKAKRSLSGTKFEDSPEYRRPDPGYFKEGEVLLKFKPDVSRLTGESLLLSSRMTVKKSFRYTGVQVIKLPPSMNVEMAIASLIKEPSIEYVEPNFMVRICDVPDDPRFVELWGLDNTGQTGGRRDADIDAPEAWDIHTGNGDWVVGVIDSGVDYTHEDLSDNMWINQAEATGTPGVDDDGNGYIDDIYGINAITGSGDPMDDAGHGTHCSGTIGAVGNNAVGVVGVNWDVEIMGLKFLDSTGSGWISDAIECIEYVLDMHTRGVNIMITSNSWGGGGYSQAAYDAISDLRDEDILFVAAAGNDGLDNDASPHYPSSYDLDNIIAVAATDHNDQLASFSSWGSNYGLTSVDVAAPGVDILSTLPGVYYEPGPGDIFFDHVEAGAGNWTPDTPWAITEENSYSPTHSWTDSPGEDYENNVNASLTSEIIDLSGTTGQHVRVGFYAWVDLETSFDDFYIQVSGDGGTAWTTVGSLTGHQTYWDLYSYYIPDSVCTNQFRFRFRLDTDGSVTYDGVYIDDIGIGIITAPGSNNYDFYSGTSMATPHVSGLAALIDSYHGGLNYLDIRDIVLVTVDPLLSLQGFILTGGRINAHNALLQDPASLPPQIYYFSPLRGPVGIDVTINGNRFGDTEGEVTFHEDIQADNIISWSNTSIVVTVPTGAIPGPVTVTTADGITSSGVYFRVGDFLNLHAFIPTAVTRAAVASVDGKIYALGGYIQGGWLETGIVQIYDPDINYWTSGSPKPTPAANAYAAVIDGLIYVAGGYQIGSIYLDTLEIYDPANDTWTTGTPLPVALSGSGAAALNGKLYVMGGSSPSGRSSALYEYEPSSGTWTQLASMNSQRSYFATGVIDGKIYAFGGSGVNGFLSSTEVYDPGTYIWTTLAPMNIRRYDLAGAAMGGRLYAFGGNSQSYWDPPYVQDVEAYVPATDTWEMDSHSLNMARQSLRPADFGSHIFVMGGYVDGISLSVNETLGRPFIPIVISYLSASPTSGVIPLEVSFAVQASGGSGSYTYSWSFRDGETSDLQNPTHTYNTADTYNVTVIVTDAGDPDITAAGRLMIIAIEQPVTLGVGISASPSSGPAPLTVNFTANISGDSPPYTLEWDFGDGTTETQSTDSDTAQISHTYNSAGAYKLWVMVTSALAGGSATQTVQASIGISVTPPPTTDKDGDGGGGGCFIATAAYGSRMEPQVELLREFRDRYLLTNSAGKSFVILYYAYSPPIACFIAKNDTLRAVVRCALLPVVAVSWIAVHLGPILSLALVLLLFGLISVGAGVTLKRVRFRLSGLGKRKTI